MSQTISQMPDEPIIIAKFTEPFDVANDTVAVAGYLHDALNNTTGNLGYIADMRDIKIQFSDLVLGMAQAFADSSSPYANPRLTTLIVASDALIALGAKAASEQQQYGKVNVKLYPSVDEALSEARRILAKR